MKRWTLLVLAACTSYGQTAPDIRVDVALVTVACSITDRSGLPAKSIRREDLTLLDNGQPREIKYLWQEADLPLTIGLIVDVSGSQASFVSKHRQTVARFLEQVLGPQDRAFIVTVATDVKLITDLTGSIEQLRAGVEQIEGRQRHGTQLGEPCRGQGRVVRSGRHRMPARYGCGGTALWNGVYSAARLKMKTVSGRKALIVLSDGMDTGSLHSLTDAIEAAQSADTMVYTIRYVSAMLMVSPALAIHAALSHGLQRLADETGGREFPAPRGSPADVFAQIENELRNLYVLGFTPPDAARDGQFHKLEVKMRQAGMTVRARKGYSVQPI